MSDDEKWVMHLDEGGLVHFAPCSFNVCDPHAELPDEAVTLYFQQLETLRDALDEFLPPRRAPVTPNDDWIPVTEGLPEKCGDYLTTLELPNGEYVSYWTYFREDRLWEPIYNYKVVAWMPLPPPWKGDDREVRD